MKEQPYQDLNFKSTETRLDYDRIIIYVKSKAKYLIKSKGSCQNHCLGYLYTNQQVIKNPNAMKVTSSQQVMSIGDFPSPINEKQKEPHSIQRKPQNTTKTDGIKATNSIMQQKCF